VLYYKPFISKVLGYGLCNKGITKFYLPPTNESYLPLLPSRKVSPVALWLVLIASTHEGMARLSWPGWHSNNNSDDDIT